MDTATGAGGGRYAGRRIVFDTVLRRPGCVLLQACAVPDPSVAHAFPPETWLTGPTPGMRVYRVESDEQMGRLVAMAVEAECLQRRGRR